MNPNSTLKTFIYTALPCEAKPLIDFYRLKKDISTQCFAIYRNDNICLTVTGIGKIAMAAGIAYSQALFSPSPNPVFLNIGIAGHKDHTIGSVFLVDKLSDYDSGRCYFPPLVFTPPCPSHSLQTVSKPTVTYPLLDLCDMEGSAYYETATRFSTGELIQCLKIVSDNELSPTQTIQAKYVSELISKEIPTITAILKELTQLTESLKRQDLTEFNLLLNQYHFTANEQIQLKKLLTRWDLLKSGNKIDFSLGQAKSGNDFIKELDHQLGEFEFHL
jgi:adenosylhomocysteine nucleosidase